MEYKTNWEEAKRNHIAWWNNEGMVLSVIAKRKIPLCDAPYPQLPENPVERWFDPDFRIQFTEYLIAHENYLGDSFPTMINYVGPGCFALYIGCEGDFSQCTGEFGLYGNNDTVWFYPCLDDLETASPLVYNTENYYWKRHLDMLKRAKEHASGRYDVGLPDLVENIDILASMRGTQKMLFDLIDRNKKDAIHRFQRQILDLWFLFYEQLYELCKGADGGCSFQTYRIWGPGRVNKTQCDLGAMISPKMYREFVLPYTIEQCDRLDYNLYHLDGPQCVCHLDAILEIKSLNAIQWTPGSAFEPCDHPRWYPLYERILKAGKSIQISATPQGARDLIKNLGQKGFFIHMYFEDENEAREFCSEYGR
jgi:hypothetical protein